MFGYFISGHYLIRHANGFLRAKLEENYELRGTDSAQGQGTDSAPFEEQIVPQMEAIVFIILQIF